MKENNVQLSVNWVSFDSISWYVRRGFQFRENSRVDEES